MRFRAQNAINILLGLLLLVAIFHVLIVIKIIPYNIAWGGRLKTDEQMFAFEGLSILINMILVFILLEKGKYINYSIKEKTLDIILWIFMVLFIVNSVANLFAQTNLEKLFAVLTLASAFFIWVIIREKANKY